jgi:hypothetical protein
LIGQLGDPLYPRKLNALYYEFAETGVHEKLGYTSPADLVDYYPQFLEQDRAAVGWDICGSFTRPQNAARRVRNGLPARGSRIRTIGSAGGGRLSVLVRADFSACRKSSN